MITRGKHSSSESEISNKKLELSMIHFSRLADLTYSGIALIDYDNLLLDYRFLSRIGAVETLLILFLVLKSS